MRLLEEREGDRFKGGSIRFHLFSHSSRILWKYLEYMEKYTNAIFIYVLYAWENVIISWKLQTRVSLLIDKKKKKRKKNGYSMRIGLYFLVKS